MGEYQYNFTRAAALMEYRNVKLPKTAGTEQGGSDNPEETEGMILERIFLFEELVSVVNDLYRMFLEVRVSGDWPSELQRVRSWVDAEGLDS